MSTKDITDVQVLEAYVESISGGRRTPDSLAVAVLERRTGQPRKVCLRAMERACGRGLIEYGVSLRMGWLTEAGKALLDAEGKT